LILNFKNRNYGTTTLLNDTLGFLKTNAKRTDRNGYKTRKLRIKQHYRDLYAINYRLQGFAEKKCKTHKIVLAKTEKFRVRSEKYHGGAGLKRWKRSRGFSAIFARHKKLHDNYRIFQGPNRETFTAASHGDRRLLFFKLPAI
jgi:hypothetical protein